MSRRLLLIANPKGGVGDNISLANRAEAYLKERGIETRIQFTEREGHAREMVQELASGEVDGICGIGGDGTMHELVNGIMHRHKEDRIPLTLLPGGTGNSFLRDLDCLDPMVALERLVQHARRSIDVFSVNVGGATRFGFNIVGWGLMSSANQLAESLRVLGRRRYDIASLLRLLRNRCYQGRLEADREVIEGGFTLLVASNTIHTGEGMKLTPHAKLDDGKLDLLYLKNTSRLAMLRMFTKLGTGGHVRDPAIHYSQVSRFKVTTDESLPVNLDGELIESGSFEVEVLPKALELLI